MVKDNKTFLLLFTLRTDMYISKTDEFTIQSFLTGYEIGKGGNYEFTEQMGEYLAEKCKIRSSSSRLYGQLIQYASKKSISWYTAFRQISLEVLASDKNGGFDEEMKNLLKTRINNLLNRLDITPYAFLDERWIEDYVAFVPIKSVWFKEMWTNDKYTILKSIHKLIDKQKLFEYRSKFTPTPALLELKQTFNALQS